MSSQIPTSWRRGLVPPPPRRESGDGTRGLNWTSRERRKRLILLNAVVGNERRKGPIWGIGQWTAEKWVEDARRGRGGRNAKHAAYRPAPYQNPEINRGIWFSVMTCCRMFREGRSGGGGVGEELPPHTHWLADVRLRDTMLGVGEWDGREGLRLPNRRAGKHEGLLMEGMWWSERREEEMRGWGKIRALRTGGKGCMWTKRGILRKYNASCLKIDQRKRR
ncbi:hypothetical protein HYDPIDRAFT_168274 [Hydnomerulius pinastri MD-312]|uniref:Uncharacterized protein n=1 Tax=Hydnomerulius pinastri MD-312 TaxID=994086 RepID=A0A0C9W8K0_9AGAM|nr:hypothetical protein HYDPIDRAFT_168274 [Hydnomerulius pinastri MD-312]